MPLIEPANAISTMKRRVKGRKKRPPSLYLGGFLFKQIRDKALYLLIPLFGGISYTYYHQHLQEEKSQQLFVLHSGVETCSARLGQSFTAFMIGQKNAPYLRPSFFKESEECLGEALREALNLETQQENLSQLFNTLSSDAHWFHEKLVPSVEANQLQPSNPLDAAQNAYKKVESVKEQVLLGLEKSNERLKKKSEQVAIVSLIIAPLFFLLSMALAFHLRRTLSKGQQLEALSDKELQEEGKRPSRHWESLVSEFMAFSSLPRTHEMFQRLVRMPVVSTREEESKEKVKPAEIEYQQSGTEMISFHMPQDIDSENKVNMELLLGRVVDLVSNNLFSKGILLNLNVKENVWAQGSEEEFLEIIYNLSTGLMELMPKTSARRMLGLTLKELGNSVLIEGSAELEQNYVEILQLYSLTQEEKLKKLGAKMQICCELMKDVGATMEVEKTPGKNAVTLRLIFQAAGKAKTLSRLTSLKKGKKRELVQELQA